MNTVVHGVLLGLVYGILAVGLVLVYRASRVVNFAHGEIGAFGAAVLAKLVLDEKWPWLVAVPVVLAIGGAIGAVTEVLIARRLAGRPRLALLVTTIGLSQLVLVGELLLPSIHVVAPFPSPLHRRLTVGSVSLGGADFVALAVVPAIVVGLALWLGRTPSGRALRATADNPDAAALAGIRPHRVTLIAWTLAGVVSTATAVVAGPLQGVVVGQRTETIGAGLLIRALAAALVGRLESFPLTMAGGVGVGLLQAAADAGHISQSAVDVILFGAVLALVVLRRAAPAGAAGPGEGELVAVSPLTTRRSLWSWALPAAAILLVPVVVGRSSELFSLSRVALYALVGLSVVVLTGWAGQLSLGQFAIVGIGTFAAAALEQHGIPFWAAATVAALIAAAVSALVGLPALRARGLDLAITTLALAVACNSWLFTQSWLTQSGGVALVTRSVGPAAYYEVCAGALVGAIALVLAVRRSGLGRRLLAVRSNERRAATAGVSAARTKLTAFALAGLLAGGAGALLGGLRVRSSAADFRPDVSLQVVALAVIGGAGSPAGALIGAVVVLGIPALFGDTTVAGLLPTGVGLLLLVVLFPGGLVELASRWRRSRPASRLPAVAVAPSVPTPVALAVSGVSVRFGGRIALDAVDLAAAPGEVVGLIGGNGAGKSTLLDAISGFVPTESGSITVGGRDVGSLSPAARARAGVGRVLQDPRLYDDLTLREAVLLGAPAAQADATLAVLGIEQWAATPCQRLSTGTRRLGELAAAIAAGPSLLLLDEPTAGLGDREAEAFTGLLRGLREALGCTIVLVEHNLALVSAVADRIVELGAGRVISDPSPGRRPPG